MIIHQFKCSNCNLIIDRTELDYQCPKCHNMMNKIFSPPLIIYKGTGFYSTDYKKNRDPLLEKGQKERQKYNKDVLRGITPKEI